MKAFEKIFRTKIVIEMEPTLIRDGLFELRGISRYKVHVEYFRFFRLLEELKYNVRRVISIRQRGDRNLYNFPGEILAEFSK